MTQLTPAFHSIREVSITLVAMKMPMMTKPSRMITKNFQFVLQPAQ